MASITNSLGAPNSLSAPSGSIMQRLLATSDSLAPIALRVPAGVIFAAHGAQKLFGWFGGYGLALLAIRVALVFSGGGRASVDRQLSANLRCPPNVWSHR